MIFVISYAIPIFLAAGTFIMSYKHYKNKWREQ